MTNKNDNQKKEEIFLKIKMTNKKRLEEISSEGNRIEIGKPRSIGLPFNRRMNEEDKEFLKDIAIQDAAPEGATAYRDLGTIYISPFFVGTKIQYYN